MIVIYECSDTRYEYDMICRKITGYMVHDSWYMVHGTRFMVHGTLYTFHGTFIYLFIYLLRFITKWYKTLHSKFMRQQAATKPFVRLCFDGPRFTSRYSKWIFS